MTDPSAPEPDRSLGRSVAERQRPLRQRRAAVAGMTTNPGRPGLLARRSTSFSLGAGLSLSSRRQLGLASPDPDVNWLPVAPPDQWDESLLPPDEIRTGDATLDHIIASQRQRQAAQPAGPQRGLRAAIGRRNTRIGRNTAPGASAHRLRPQAAPPALSPDVRRMVSGDGPAFGLGQSPRQPGAPSSGGRAAPSRSPRSQPGRRARGRVERSAPWHHYSAQPLAPSLGHAGPISVSGRGLARADSGAGSSLGAIETPGRSTIPAGLTTSTGLPADGAVVAGAPVGPAPVGGGSDIAATVAAIAGSVEEFATERAERSIAVSGSMARGSRPLVPSVRAPGSARATPAGSASPIQRLAQHHPVAPSGAGTPSPGRLARGNLAAIEAGAAPPPAIPAAAAANTARPALAGSANRFGSTAATAAVATSSAAPTSAPPAATAGEPPLATMLRAAPPAIALSTSPRRSFTSPDSTARVAGVAVAAAGGGSFPFGPGVSPSARLDAANLAVSPGGGVIVSPAGVSAGATAGAPSRGPAGAPSRPGSPVGATPVARATPGSVLGGARAARGLGSVASLVSTPAASSAIGQTAAAMGSTLGKRPGGTPAGSTSSDFARRTVRRLPDLAVPAPIGSPASAPLAAAAVGAATTTPAMTSLGATSSASVVGASGPDSVATSAQVARALQAAMQMPSNPAAGLGPGPAVGAGTGGRRPALRFTPSPQLTPSARLASTAPGLAPIGGSAGGVSPAGPSSPLSGATPIAPPPAMPVDPGERFDQVLAQHSRPALSKLPQRFEPIARAILPDPSRVRISTGLASRQALGAVGKKAATAGDVVHLAQPLDDTRRSIEILAHELTHVANPSPLVRFLDDDRDSAEERQAREMETLMARSPVGTPPASPPAPSAPAPVAGSSNGFSGNGSPAGASTAGGPPAAAPASAPSSSSSNRGPAGTLEPDTAPEQDPINIAGLGPMGSGTTAGAIDLDRLLDALESRIIRELERRGRRWPRAL